MEYLEPFHADDLSVAISERLVPTADSTDALLDDSVSRLLHAMRERMEMDVVFVSEFIAGQRMFRHVDAAPGAPDVQAGGSSPAEESVCQRIVEGRVPELVTNLGKLPPENLPEMPFRAGAQLSTPIVLNDKRVYGTLCGFSIAPGPGAGRPGQAAPVRDAGGPQDRPERDPRHRGAAAGLAAGADGSLRVSRVAIGPATFSRTLSLGAIPAAAQGMGQARGGFGTPSSRTRPGLQCRACPFDS